MDPALGRFAQADTIIPGAGDPQAWDRYAFVNNNPLRYTDPDGHGPVGDYFTGLILELGRTLAWFSPQAQKDLAIQPSESDAMLAGGLTTDVAAMVAGAGAITEGASGAGVGVAACATGAGCIVSGVVVASGGALILMGAGGGLRAAEGAATALAQFASRGSNGSSMTDSQIRDSIRSFQDLIPEHEAKPQAYIEDPDAYDNLGLLKGASKELREQIIQGRIEKLQAEIEKFKGELQKMYDILREN